MALIELRDLRKSYHLDAVALTVLRGINLSIESGEYIALTGSSGSGKSTLMNMLGCLDRPTSGSYLLDGHEVTRLSTDERAALRNQRIGFVFQSFNLLRRTSALENVMLPLSYTPHLVTDKEARQRATELLKRVGLGDRLGHEPSQLSGGQQQRVAIARALINKPSIVLADEPTGNLDSHTTEEMLRMFADLNEQEKITLIMVTHEADVAARARRIIRLQDGEILSSSQSIAQGGAQE